MKNGEKNEKKMLGCPRAWLLPCGVLQLGKQIVKKRVLKTYLQFKKIRKQDWGRVRKNIYISWSYKWIWALPMAPFFVCTSNFKHSQKIRGIQLQIWRIQSFFRVGQPKFEIGFQIFFINTSNLRFSQKKCSNFSSF